MRVRSAAAVVLSFVTGELLGEWRSLPEDGSFPVDDVNGDDEDERYTNC